MDIETFPSIDFFELILFLRFRLDSDAVFWYVKYTHIWEEQGNILIIPMYFPAEHHIKRGRV